MFEFPYTFNTEISSTLIVQGTLYMLLALSVATWAVVLLKTLQQLRVVIQNSRFSRAFRSAGGIDARLELAGYSGPFARIAHAGFAALTNLDTAVDARTDTRFQRFFERALGQQIQKEKRSLESRLAVLASVGSVSPFVGLFGTVVGIMHALKQITKAGSANLDVVAGPIGEALIATAVGIAVAIPAVLAYNYFVRRAKIVSADLNDFADDFLQQADQLVLRSQTLYSVPGDRHRDNSVSVPSEKTAREAYA